MGASAGANASTNGEANAEGTASGKANGDARQTTEIAEHQPGFGEADQEHVAGDPLTVTDTGSGPVGNSVELLGARHDLRLTSSAASTPACTCLAVALGAPSDPRFDWLSGAPRTNPEVELVIALGSAGVSCPGVKEGSLGASYWGYRWSGDDIVVLVEAAKLGRPITTGAIIPKPFGSGKVYVEPVRKKAPYGRALSGSGRCSVGNPGPARTRPRTADEVPTGATGGEAPATEPAPATDDTPEIVNPE